VRVKLLLDENMAASVVGALCTEGIDVCHIRDRNMLGVKDESVLDRAFEEDRILVTANVDDFVRLVRKRELHAGLILIEDGSLHRDEQLATIRAAVGFIAGRDMANRVLWVDLDGVMEVEEIPPTALPR
jgi:predicted nuclease of predicted toxin-antitoxin system